jgi:hypothetical protein
MTNLEIIKYLTTNNPPRLAELLDDIYCSAWNCGSYAATSDGNVFSEHEIDDFGEWINQEANTNFFFDHELEEWSKAINKPTIEIEYPDNLIIELPLEGKDPNHMWNTDNNFNLINKAIDELKLLGTIMDREKYSNDTYNNFRKDLCAYCPCTECLQSQMDIVECPKFESYTEGLT